MSRGRKFIYKVEKHLKHTLNIRNYYRSSWERSGRTSRCWDECRYRSWRDYIYINYPRTSLS